MIKEINTKKAPKAIGPYSQGIDLGNIVILSGQIPVDPKTGLINNDISEQVNQSLNNIRAILEKVNLKVTDIVKTTLFITNINDFKIINATYEFFFKKYHSTLFPARSCVEVSRLPQNVKVEIEAIAYRM